MKAARTMLFVGLAFVAVQVVAHAHEPPGPGSNADPIPSPPQAATQSARLDAGSGHDVSYAVEQDRDGYNMRGACFLQHAPHPLPDTAGADANANGGAIDWCALAPYDPRYEPQVPASWWWRYRRARWNGGRW